MTEQQNDGGRRTGLRGRIRAAGANLSATGPAGRRLALLSLGDSVGTGAFLSVSVIFYTQVVGLTVAQVGFGLGASAAIALVTAVPFGLLADRFGARRLLVIVCLWRAACFAALPFVDDFTGFLLVLCVLGLVDKTAAPILQALAGQAVSEDQRVHTMAWMRTLRNVGFTVGAGLGSAALAVDTRSAYAAVLLANAASFVLVAVIAGRLSLRGATGNPLRRTVSLRALTDWPYLTLAALNGVITLHMPLLGIAIPLVVAQHYEVPKTIAAPLFALNTVLAVAFQVRASRGSEHAGGAAKRLTQAGYALVVCCGLLAVVPGLPLVAAVVVLVAAIVALTVGELFQSAGGWGLSYELARDGQQGAYLSVFWLGLSVQSIAAPVLISVVLAAGVFGWVALSAVLAVAGLLVPPVTRWAQAVRAREAAAVTAADLVVPATAAVSTSGGVR